MIIDAGIFDLDGVITDTAITHYQAWKQTFDEYLASQTFTESDYHQYVDGKPREAGIESFLQSRNITVNASTLADLAETKQQRFLSALETEGVVLFPSTMSLIHQLRKQQIKVAVVSSSKNCQMILDRAEIEALFDTRVDGLTCQESGLPGKPAPDMFLEAASRIQVDPRRAFIVEDAISGAQAGSAGHFGCVIGIDRQGGTKELLYENGADIVVTDINEITLADINTSMQAKLGS